MHSSYSRWGSRQRQHRIRRQLLRRQHLQFRQGGFVAAGRPETQVNSVANAAKKDRRLMVGRAPVVQGIRENSALSVELRNLPESLYINAISVDGSRKIPRTRRNSVRNAGIPLMTMISNNGGNKDE